MKRILVLDNDSLWVSQSSVLPYEVETAHVRPAVQTGCAMSLQVRRRVLPGFGLTMGITLLYLSLIVLIPLATLPARSFTMSWQAFRDTVTDPRVVASYRLSLGASLAAAAVNAVFGGVVAWVLARYSFPGRRVVDALIDLPFALPTAVAGIVLTTLYAPGGWLGKPLAQYGVTVAFTPLGVTVALIFIGLPFVVRTLQPVIEDLDPEVEEAATSLGASRTGVLLRVILPNLLPAWLTGFALAFARALGEYGSVVFISGNMRERSTCTAQWNSSMTLFMGAVRQGDREVRRRRWGRQACAVLLHSGESQHRH